jgi:membrane protease YdiL (CAAX protease family)
VFVFLVYLFGKFSVLSMTDRLPVEHPLLVATIIATFGGACAAVLAGTWVNRRNGGLLIGRMRLAAIQWAYCVGGGVLTLLAACTLVIWAPEPSSTNPLFAKAFLDKGPAILMWWMATLLVAAPIGEEMVFRGAFQGYLARRIGTGAAIIVAALLFLIVHLPQLDGYWPAMVSILGLGIAAGIARAKTGSLMGAIAVHISYNSAVMAFVLAGRA